MKVISDIIRMMKFPPCLILSIPMCIVLSCSEGEVSYNAAVGKMIDAYGGPDKVQMLQTYTGKGFMRDLSNRAVIRNNPFDVFKKKQLYKTRVTSVSKGKPEDIMITIYDGRELYQWRPGQGKESIPQWELYINQFKFPAVLERLQNPSVRGEVVTDPEKNLYLLKIKDSDYTITLSLDDSSWLLQEVEITSGTDSAFVYSEAYGDYRKIDGVPFPNRYIGTFRNQPYYEYMIPVVEYGIELPDSLFAVTREDTAFISLMKARREEEQIN